MDTITEDYNYTLAKMFEETHDDKEVMLDKIAALTIIDEFDCELLSISPSLPPSVTSNADHIPAEDEDEENSSTSSYKTHLNIECYPRDINDWDNTHIMKWILELYDSENYRYEDLSIHYFRDKTGACLKDLDESFWMKIDTGRGSWLYKKVQDLINALDYKCTLENGHQLLDAPSQIINVPKKRGRPPKPNSKPRNKEKVGSVWEFLRDLLKDPNYCPQFIRWDNYEQLEFRLVEPNTICEIRGQRQKKGKVVTYEHFSRSLRYYYNLSNGDPNSTKSKILPVPDRRLVYKFNKNVLVPDDYKQFFKYWE